jgi:hypothetical protein
MFCYTFSKSIKYTVYFAILFLKVYIFCNTFSKSIKMETNDVTLKYLTNPYYQNVITARNKNIINEDEPGNNITKEDIQFYRKRIVALTKDMLKGIHTNNEVKKEYEEYVHHMINYFKMVDRKDILQKQYIEEGEEKKVDEDDNDDDGIDISNIKMEKVNELMMKKTIKVANLNDFVIITNTTKKEGGEEMPKKKEIDLKSPNLKTKGIIKKGKKKIKE